MEKPTDQPPTGSTVAPQTKNSKPRTKKYLRLLTGVVILLLVIAGGWYFYAHVVNKGVSQQYSFHYKGLNTYTLSGPQDGSGISITKPTEVGQSGKSAAKTSQIALTQTATNANQPVAIAEINMASVSVGTPVTTDYRKLMGETLTSPSDTGYKAMVQPLQDYVTKRLTTDYTTTFSTPKALTTTNIKDSAWEADFTAVTKNSKDKAKLPDLQGEVILAVGKTTFYYVSLAAVNYNWQGNQAVWNQAINSLKIDQ